MSVKTFNTRVKNKIDTISTWNSSTTIPLNGEIVIGTSTSANSNSSPYIMKIGDGTSQWNVLPTIGPNIFQGQTATFNDTTNVLSVTLTPDTKTYAIYQFPESDNNTEFTISASCDKDIMLTEHYILIDNTLGNYEKSFDGISITINGTSISASNIYLQKTYLSAGDIMELKLCFFRINNVLKCSVTAVNGIVNGGQIS